MRLSKKRRELFKELTEAIGVFGREAEVSRILKKHYTNLADNVIYDNLGSIVAHKKSKVANPAKVLVLAHMDEVGFRVGKITNEGLIKFSEGQSGIWEQTLMAQRVYVQTNEGKRISGVINSIPPHLLTQELRQKPMATKDLFVDIGCKSKEEVEALGINLNDSIVVKGEFTELNDGQRLTAKSFDNRYGCILGIELLEALKNQELPYDLYVGASVQEEIGLRGAQTITQKLDPDFVIVLDCSPANDIGIKDGFGRLGGGVLSRFVDANMIAFPQLLEYQRNMCEKKGVQWQPYLSLGGTDAGIVHKTNGGVLTLTHCICARNIHTNSAIIDLNDYEGAKKVLVAMIKDLNKDKIEKFKTMNR